MLICQNNKNKKHNKIFKHTNLSKTHSVGCLSHLSQSQPLLHFTMSVRYTAITSINKIIIHYTKKKFLIKSARKRRANLIYFNVFLDLNDLKIDNFLNKRFNPVFSNKLINKNRTSHQNNSPPNNPPTPTFCHHASCGAHQWVQAVSSQASLALAPVTSRASLSPSW